MTVIRFCLRLRNLDPSRRWLDDRALLAGVFCHDASGDYPSYMGQPGEDGAVALVVRRVALDEAGRPKHHMHNSDALWLTMWNLNVLWGLGWPEMMDEFSASMIPYARVGGRLPSGSCAGGYTGLWEGAPPPA
jgi:hypothetical protein